MLEGKLLRQTSISDAQHPPPLQITRSTRRSHMNCGSKDWTVSRELRSHLYVQQVGFEVLNIPTLSS